jgi:ankyrin repeat protein
LDEIGLTNLSGDKDAATSLLLTSLSKCDIDFFDFCIDRGAQIPPPDSNGNNLIHKAILSADLSDDEKVQKFGILLEKLIKCGVDINHKNKNGDTPLHTVILAHFAFTIPAPEEIQIIRAQALLRHGAKTDIKNKKSECLFEMENASPGVKEYVLQVREGLNLAMISQRTFKPSDKPGNTKGLPVVLARLATTYLGQ